MLKKLLLALTLFAVMPAVCMEYVIRVPKTIVKIITQDGQEFEVDKEQAKCSETLKNLIEDAGDDTILPLPNISGLIWSKIQILLPLVLEKKVLDQNEEQTAADQQRSREIEAGVRALLLSYDGVTLAGLIAAFDYLDIQMLHDLAIDIAKRHTNEIAFIKEALDLDIPILLDLVDNVVKNIGKNTDIKKIPFEQIAAFPSEIRNSIILGQMMCTLGPVPGKQLAVCNGHTDLIFSACVSQDGNTIVSGSDDSTVRIWNKDGTVRAVCSGHTSAALSVCVSQDGTTIVSGSRDGTVRICNKDGTARAVCNGHRAEVNAICVSQDGTTIVSGSDDSTMRIWNKDGTLRAVCNGHTDMVISVCISQDGTTIVSGSYDGTMRIWNTDGKQLAVFDGHTSRMLPVCVSQDGTTIVSGSWDGTVHIWNIDGTERATCNGHTCPVTSVCMSQDGNTIVSGCSDGTVRIWNMNGTERAVWNGDTRVESVCMSQNCNVIVSGSQNSIVHVWDISLLNRISTMDSEQAQAIWQYLQSDHAKDWNGVAEYS